MKLTARSLRPASWRDRRLVGVDPIARPAGLDAHDLGRGLVDRDRAGGDERVAHVGGVVRRADDVDAEVGGDEQDRGAGDLAGAVGVLGRGQAGGVGDLAARGPMTDSRPCWTVRLCSSACQPIAPRRIWSKSACSDARSVSRSSSPPVSSTRRSPSILPLFVSSVA